MLRDRMLDALGELVAAESPSDDPDALARCADVLASLGTSVLGIAATPSVDGIVQWTFGSPRVLVLGHYDTVWPIGTRPFSVIGDIATGPGVFDMKAGVVQALFAAAELGCPDGLCLLWTCDEETGSVRSRATIEKVARECEAVLVAEPAAGEAVKVGRKGVSTYEIRIHGRAAHAGLEPHLGVNAAVELAHQVLQLNGLGSGSTTVTPTVVSGGTTSNTVPAEASVVADVRAASETEQRRVDDAIRGLRPVLDGAVISVEGGANRPPFERSMSSGLYQRACEVASDLGLGDLAGVEVGGGSDGNFTAALGIPTLDGLGAVGGGAHADDEHVFVSKMPERASLLAGLVRSILR